MGANLVKHIFLEIFFCDCYSMSLFDRFSVWLYCHRCAMHGQRVRQAASPGRWAQWTYDSIGSFSVWLYCHRCAIHPQELRLATPPGSCVQWTCDSVGCFNVCAARSAEKK